MSHTHTHTHTHTEKYLQIWWNCVVFPEPESDV